MFVSVKAAAAAPRSPTSIASSFSVFLLKSWNAWDVRAMVLLSLLLQIALFVFGKRRKCIVSITINRMILWIAYQSKDWVAVAALGKLSNSHEESPTSNVLRALWAPLLILHLGGPDTITAYAFEDTQLWTRHLLTLLVQSIFAIYVIYLSWTQIWFSFLTLPLILAGIIKYGERVWCLNLTNLKKSDWIISIFNDPAHPSLPAFENRESKIVLLGYLLFSVMRPDVNDYLCHREYFLSFSVRIDNYLRETVGQFSQVVSKVLELLRELREGSQYFNIAAAELGFIFDVVYTKAALIYTKTGCLLRLTCFIVTFAVLLVFPITITDESKSHFDIFVTISLLVGAVTLEFCNLLSMLSSDWAVLLTLFHGNCLVHKIIKYVLQYLPCFVPQRRRLSVSMGQFNLLDFCWDSRKDKICWLSRNSCRSDFLENWSCFRFTKFKKVPSCLKRKELYQIRLMSFFTDNSFEATRGQKTLSGEAERQKNPGEEAISDMLPVLEKSINVDFDTSIITWHLATSICYHQDHDLNNARSEDMKISKYLSNYLMYLLVMQPAMILPEHCRSFWFDHALDKLRHTFSESSDKSAAFSSLHLSEFRSEPALGNTSFENLLQFSGLLATKLNQSNNKWKLIKNMWIEMLLYAAHSCQHINHVKQLGQYGREFLTLIWIMGGYHIIEEVICMRETKGTCFNTLQLNDHV